VHGPAIAAAVLAAGAAAMIVIQMLDVRPLETLWIRMGIALAAAALAGVVLFRMISERRRMPSKSSTGMA
jgi:hypothetical protein